MIQQHAGAIGTGVTATTGIAGFVTKALPLLQFVSLSVSIVAGVLTAIWYIKKFKRGE